MTPEFENWLKNFLIVIGIVIVLISLMNTVPNAVNYYKKRVIYVHVCGAVRKPGLYKLSPGSRVNDAVELAEPKLTADLNAINLARKLRDGEKIVVPYREELKVNLNKASVEELEKLPGVTRKLAERIVSYRQRIGKLSSLQELLEVKGIDIQLIRDIEPYVEL